MLGLFGKKRVKEEQVAAVFVSNINQIAINSFPLIADYLNNVCELKSSPTIRPSQVEWFLYIVLAANLENIDRVLSVEQATRLRVLIIDEFLESLEGVKKDDVEDNIENFSFFMKSLSKKCDDSLPKMIATALFYKYGLNDYQDEHFKQMNQPNPIIIKAICEFSADFLWNWDDLLEKYKMVA